MFYNDSVNASTMNGWLLDNNNNNNLLQVVSHKDYKSRGEFESVLHQKLIDVITN